MRETLFLLKSGQAKQFFQQNITFLAQPEGYQVATRYKRRWVQHAPGDPLPEHVVIVYTEPPYQHALPVREATLLKYEVDELDDSITYWLTLGSLLAPIRLEESDAFLHRHRPSETTFVFLASDPPLARTMTSAKSRWQALVTHLTSASFAPTGNPYASALFAFAHPLTLPSGQNVDLQQPLGVGQSYQQTISILAPGLSRGELEEVQLHLDYPRPTVMVTPQPKLDKGEILLKLQLLQILPNPWTITTSFRPASLPSGPVHLLLPPIVPLVATTDAEREPFQRLQLFEWLSPKIATRDQLRLLDRYLIPRADGQPPDPHLLLARATLLKKEGQASEAMDTLLQIPPDQQNDEMVILLLECAVAARRQLSFIQLLDQLTDWDDGQLVQRLVRAIASLSEEVTLPLAYHLCRLAPIYTNLIWQEIGPTIQQQRYRLSLVRFLQGDQNTQQRSYLRLPPNEIYTYLVRNAEPERVNDEYLDYLVEAGLRTTNPSGMGSYFLEWMTRHLHQAERKEVEAIQERFSQATPWLSTVQEEAGVVMLLDALKRTGLAEKALWLALSRVDDALRAANFERAERWLREARNTVSALPSEGRSAMLSLIKDEDDRIKQARHEMTTTFAPRYGSDPGLAPILKLYNIESADAFWYDLAEVMGSNEHVVRQLIARLDQLQQFAQQTGSTNANIHSLSALQGNVSRMELTDTARLIFKKIGRTIKLIALYANHDAYDEAIKQRFELMNRIQRG